MFKMGFDFMGLVKMYLENTSLIPNNSVPDLRKPLIKSSLENIYPLFIFLHTLVLISGITGNATMLVYIIKRNLYQKATFLYLINLCLANIFIVLIVMPFTLAHLMVQNWIFPGAFCYLLPMLHSLVILASMFTYLTIATDRCRHIVYPMKTKIHPGMLCVSILYK